MISHPPGGHYYANGLMKLYMARGWCTLESVVNVEIKRYKSPEYNIIDV